MCPIVKECVCVLEMLNAVNRNDSLTNAKSTTVVKHN